MEKKNLDNFFKLDVLKRERDFSQGGRRRNDNPNNVPQEMENNFLWEKETKLLQGATS